MPLRIYSLAKELNIDSKLLVDLCAKAGVTGKGSALASLTDEEATRVREFLSKPTASAPAAPVRPAQPAAAPVVAAPTEPAPMRREDYVPPTGATGRPGMMGQRSQTPLRRKSAEGDAPRPAGKPPAKPAAPAIRVAPMPPSQQPVEAKGPEEPPAQKPDLRLPADAIRASKSGREPLGEHLRRHEAKRKADTETRPPREPAPRGKPAPGAAPLSDAARERSKRGKGKEGAPAGEEGIAASLGGREARQLRRKTTVTDGRKKVDLSGEDERRTRGRGRRPRQRTGASTAAPRKGKVSLALPCTVREFSAALGVPVTQVLGKLLSLGMPAAITASLDGDQVDLLSIEFGVEVDVKHAVTLEDQLISTIEQAPDDPANVEPRPPVVTFLGHVDHGKTSLLDRIIGTNVVSGESGGITQHIRAYRVEKDGRAIAFVDTPGHEAFTEMRARGANVTDIAVLVVAADDGVMPQTEEAISHAKAAGVPIVIALNKTDLPGVNYDKIYTELVTNGLQPTEWGGDTELVRCSALTGAGVDELLNTLLTIAELSEYKADPQRQAFGTCLEAEVQEDRGVIAKLLVQNGTLRVGDIVVCGPAYGRVKAMYDTLRPREKYDAAGPSTPVNVIGLNTAPGAGDRFYVLNDVAKAREIAETRASKSRQAALGSVSTHVTLENLFDRLSSSAEVQTLNMILRADTRGSIEAIQKELGKLEHPEVQIKVLHKAVGGITEGDVTLADASDAVIIGFNVVPDEGARQLAEQRGVQIRRYDIIYQVTDDLRAALEGMLKPEQRQVELGRALVQKTFAVSRFGVIAGCRVLSGAVERNCRVRVTRDSVVIGDYALDSLRREKDDVREVREGYECGMKLAGFNDLKEGDVLETYKVEEVARTL